MQFTVSFVVVLTNKNVRIRKLFYEFQQTHKVFFAKPLCNTLPTDFDATTLTLSHIPTKTGTLLMSTSKISKSKVWENFRVGCCGEVFVPSDVSCGLSRLPDRLSCWWWCPFCGTVRSTESRGDLEESRFSWLVPWLCKSFFRTAAASKWAACLASRSCWRLISRSSCRASLASRSRCSGKKTMNAYFSGGYWLWVQWKRCQKCFGLCSMQSVAGDTVGVRWIRLGIKGEIVEPV